MKKKIQVLAYVLIIIFVSLQFIPVDRENPQTESAAEIIVPAEVQEILENSCYDCHSNKTEWPAYSYIAPVSWLVTKDVNEGRKELNFSVWNEYPIEKKRKKAEEIKEEVNEGKMPMPIYTFIHSSAKLSDLQKSILNNWVSAISTKAESE